MADATPLVHGFVVKPQEALLLSALSGRIGPNSHRWPWPADHWPWPPVSTPHLDYTSSRAACRSSPPADARKQFSHGALPFRTGSGLANAAPKPLVQAMAPKWDLLETKVDLRLSSVGPIGEANHSSWNLKWIEQNLGAVAIREVTRTSW